MNDSSDQTGQAGQSGRYADAARRYRLDSRIATGGMGVVWRATDTRLHREVAVKVLKDEYADDDTFRARFDTEARNAASLHHPNIAGVFDYDSSPAEGHAPFLVMELVDGRPLSALLAGGRPLDPDVVRDLLAQAADGLATAHRAGIVHRDVKPANLVVTSDRQVKVTDFGIARAGDAAQITRTGAVMGTPQYLAPEQALGKPATAASDVYALGVVAYEALVGSRPFEGDSPVATIMAHSRDPVPELPASVPADLAAVVRRAMAKEPGERFADGAALATALRDPSAVADLTPATSVMPATSEQTAGQPMDRLSAPAPYDPEPATTTEPTGENRRRKQLWPIVLLVVLLIAAIALIGWLLLAGDDSEEPTDAPTTSAPATSETAPTTPTSPTDPGPATVQVDEGDYVGRNVDQVASELRGLGLETAFSEVANDGSQEADTVASLDPTGSVEEGSVITVEFYGAPPETESPSPTQSPTSATTGPTASATTGPTASATTGPTTSAAQRPTASLPTEGGSS